MTIFKTFKEILLFSFSSKECAKYENVEFLKPKLFDVEVK